MSNQNTLSRRGFLGALTALGSIGLSACATSSPQTSRVLAADRTTGQLPPRGEFVVRNAYLVTMDPQLGDIPRGDVHVRNGTLVAVGPNLAATGSKKSTAATGSPYPASSIPISISGVASPAASSPTATSITFR